MNKAIALMSILVSASCSLWADDTTYLRHNTLQVGDVLNYTNNSLGFGTTAPASMMSFQVTNTDKTIPLIKISQNVGTPSYGIIFDGQGMSGDPRVTALRIVDVPSRNTLMAMTRSTVMFGNPPDTYFEADALSSAATVIVSQDKNTNPFSGTLLLLDSATSDNAPDYGTAALPEFGTLRGRNSSRPGTILKIINDSTTHEIRFGHEASGGHNYLTVTVLPDGAEERTVYFKITRSVGAKTFIIDHPLKESNYLVHAGLESPHADVVYMGSSSLKNGTQTIRLPDYFESLTHLKGRTIRITRIDGFDPLELVTHTNGEVIHKGAFTVRSSKPSSSQHFEWEVKATRKDTKPFEVEPLKETVDVNYFGPYSWPKLRIAK